MANTTDTEIEKVRLAQAFHIVLSNIQSLSKDKRLGVAINQSELDQLELDFRILKHQTEDLIESVSPTSTRRVL